MGQMPGGPSGMLLPYAKAELSDRVLGLLIDVVPLFVVGVLISWIPILGIMLMGAISAAYWLLRDSGGASLGKRLMKLTVINKDGQPSQTSQRVLRNVTLAIGPALLVIPILGWAAAGPLSFLIGLAEIIALATRGERVGDMIANTAVVKIK